MSNPPHQRELFPTMPAAPELDEHIAADHPTRRNLLIGTAGVIAGMRIDQEFGQLVWGGTDPKITTYSQKNLDAFPHASWLIVPGFGVSHTESIAKPLQPTMDEYGQIAGVTYSPNGLQMDDLARNTANYCLRNRISTLHMYGHSMGGMVAVELAALLKRKHNILTDIVVLDCSPQQLQDVKGDVKRLGVELLAMAGRLSYHGGPLTRMALEVAVRLTDKGESFTKAFAEAFNRDKSTTASNELLQSLAGYMPSYRASKFLKHLGGTTMCHLAPQHADRDNVVDKNSSRIHWTASSLDKKLLCADGPHTGHADPGRYQAEYNGMLHRVTSLAHLVTAEEARRYDRHLSRPR